MAEPSTAAACQWVLADVLTLSHCVPARGLVRARSLRVTGSGFALVLTRGHSPRLEIGRPALSWHSERVPELWRHRKDDRAWVVLILRGLMVRPRQHRVPGISARVAPPARSGREPAEQLLSATGPCPLSRLRHQSG